MATTLIRTLPERLEFYGSTVQAQSAINKLLSLPASGREQDWEIGLDDPGRIDEMLEPASNADLSLDKRRALALLTIASIDEAAQEGRIDQQRIQRAKHILRQNEEVRHAIIFYWIEKARAFYPEIVRSMVLD